MKKGTVTFIKIFISSLIILISLYLLQRLLVPKYAAEIVEGAMIAEYYQEEKEHDVIFIGDCEVYENFSPQVLWDDFGINSYIRGSAQQLIWQSYYILEDTLRYEIPKAVIFNVQSMQFDKPDKEAYNRMTLEGMEWSAVKIKAISASMTEKENYLDYIFPILRYHTRWDDITTEDFTYLFDTPRVSHNGYYMRVDTRAAESVPDGRPLADYSFSEIDYEYLDKITRLCKVNDIQLVLVKAPSLYPFWYEQWEEQMEKYARENELLYINFLELAEEIGLDFDTDTYDGGLHMNLSGAEKITEYLGGILSEQMKLPDRRGEEALASVWEDKRRLYEEDREKQYLAVREEESKMQDEGVADKTASDGKEDTEMEIEEEQEKDGTGKKADYKGYAFIYHDIVIAIDAEAKPVLEQIGEADSYFEAASCAFNGLDKMYTYGSFELDTYPADEKDYVSMILLKDDSVATAEGVSIGEPEEKITEVYGEGFAKENGMIVYKKEGMKLCFIVENGTVTSIEYRTAVLDE